MKVRHTNVAAVMLCLAASACTHDQGKPAATEQPADAASASPAIVAADPVASPSEPAMEKMQRAVASGKLSAPVDVLYQLNDEVAANRSVRIDFAVSPLVAGDNLRFELVESDAAIIESADSKLTVQKADANGVYRKSVMLTPRVASTKLQVIVYMNVGGDTYSGVYSIPIGAAAAVATQTGKKNVKQEQR